MKRTILLLGLIASIPLQLYSMEPLEKKTHQTAASIPTLQDLSTKAWIQKQLFPLIRKNISDFAIIHQEIKTLVQNTPPGVLELLGTQFYEMCKPALTNLFLTHPIVSFAEPEDPDYFINQIEFDPSGRYCMTMKKHIDYEWKKKRLDLYTLPHFTLTKTFKMECDYAKFSPQGKFLSTYHEPSGTITLHDTHNDFASCTFNAPKSVYTFNAPETAIFSTNEHGTCQTWDINTQQKIADIAIPGQVTSIDALGNYIIYCTINPVGARYIDTITLITPVGQQLNTITIDASQDKINSGYCKFAIHPERKLFAMSSYSTIFIWNLEKNTLIKKFAHADNVNTIIFDKSGTFLASASDDWTARVWNIETGKELMLGVEDSRHIVQDVTFSPQNNILFSSDSCIRLWDLAKPQLPHIGSTPERTGDVNITVCPITTQGLLFGGSSSENIWCAPTPKLFTLEQFIWLYAAFWAKKNLKGEKLKIYMTDLKERIDLLFAEHTELIRKHLQRIIE